ncbi:hypothetical protein LMG27174_05870 [Paraburkholderia rhynchosiae]|uniref:Uncharacterized protein n=1 Tax=Paraburkholderia rhynchosiae TaxID=487049 RepID=A0A6J5CA21_9BURK|nr:hypothetical protein LMG27174_05870 [Paraburkholderia rhynchosiae]
MRDNAQGFSNCYTCVRQQIPKGVCKGVQCIVNRAATFKWLLAGPARQVSWS